MFTIILLIPLLTFPLSQELKSIQPTNNQAPQGSNPAAFKCSQPSTEQEPLIREAVKNRFWVRRVEFLGNEYTRDDVLRQRIMLQEGDTFTRENLVKSLKSVNRLKGIIYPVKLSDVIIRLNRREKIIDMTICFKERRKKRRGAMHIAQPERERTLPSFARLRCLTRRMHARLIPARGFYEKGTDG
jgi:Surface antigen variable number repeat